MCMRHALLVRSLLSLPVQLPGKTLLDYFHHHRRVSRLGLRDEQMKVLRHDHISVDDKAVLAARLFQDFHKQVAPPRRTQFWLAAVTTAGAEVQIVRAIIAMESLGHPVRIVTRVRA